jgi:hypothetical protein
MVSVKSTIAVPLAQQLYKNVELKNCCQAACFFKMLRRPPATKLYHCADLVKNLQLAFNFWFHPVVPSARGYDADGHHLYFDVYEPFIQDVEYGFKCFRHLASLNVFVDMHDDDASLSRLINMLLGPVQAGVKPFVLRLKCLKSEQVRSST